MIFYAAYRWNHWAIQDSNLKLQPVVDKTLSENHQNQKVYNPVHILTIYPKLEAIVKAWPNLPEHIKTAIKTLGKSVKGEK